MAWKNAAYALVSVREAPAKSRTGPSAGSVRNKRERRKVLAAVYGDSSVDAGGWVDLDRIDVEIEALLEHDAAQAERWFLNRCFASEGAAFNIEAWRRNAKPKRVTAEGGKLRIISSTDADYLP